mmetsp:Transcript_10712/g.39665  ORF Transcript_10712/g.39665 Transcript_10712/m.39665 type:complete len:224 (-) Transcript_10712:1412-2083(-)
MPCPMRLGPPPRMRILLALVGFVSSFPSYDEYMYGVSASNSAAHVSTRFMEARTSSATRALRTSISVVLSARAIWMSLNPRRFTSSQSCLSKSATPVRPLSQTSVWYRSSIWVRYHGSNSVILRICSTVMPDMNASWMAMMRSGLGVPSVFFSNSGSAIIWPDLALSPQPFRPVSSERSALLKDSCHVLPMAIASPTDFICVVKMGSEPGNFSNVKRGILVMT